MERELYLGVFDSPVASGINFRFKIAPTYRAVKVKYYTVLNAFSYVGGLFNSIFAFFFLLKWYAATLPDF